MRKKQFGILLTISLSKDIYELVKELSELYEISMGEVVRNSIEYSMHYDGSWMASKRNTFTAQKDKGSIDFSDYNLGEDLQEGEEKVLEEVEEYHEEQ
jgi:hypothetical protein